MYFLTKLSYGIYTDSNHSLNCIFLLHWPNFSSNTFRIFFPHYRYCHNYFYSLESVLSFQKQRLKKSEYLLHYFSNLHLVSSWFYYYFYPKFFSKISFLSHQINLFIILVDLSTKTKSQPKTNI